MNIVVSSSSPTLGRSVAILGFLCFLNISGLEGGLGSIYSLSFAPRSADVRDLKGDKTRTF